LLILVKLLTITVYKLFISENNIRRNFLKRNQVIKIYNFIFRSLATFNLFGGDKNVYVCIKFEQQTVTNSDAYYFYLGSGMFYMI
jgi:hypothetical protein